MFASLSDPVRECIDEDGNKKKVSLLLVTSTWFSSYKVHAGR